MADIPIVSWDKTNPADSQNRSLGDDRITELKTQVREVMEVDHEFIYTGQGTEWGYHNKITFKIQAGNPATVADSVILFAKNVTAKAELHLIDEDSNTMQLTSAGSWIGGMVDEIRMWYGTLSSLPAGWGLCSGVSGKPNHYNRFVRSINTDTTEPQANTGGSLSMTLGLENLPAHSHNISGTGTHAHRINCAGTGSLNAGGPSSSVGTYESASGWVGNSDGNHIHGTTNEGSGSSFDNQPAYYELAFLVKL